MQLSWWFSVAFFCPHGYTNAIETGLYYLQSRYYNPSWGRFINADSLVDNRSAISQNGFAYCGNNPISRTDTTGNIWNTVFGAIIGGFAAALTRKEDGGTESFGQAFWRGAVTGAIAGAALDICIATAGAGGVLIAAGGGFVASMGDSIWRDKNNHQEVDMKKAVLSGIIGAGTNSAFGAYGRVDGRKVGNSLVSVGKAVFANGVRAVTTNAGKFLVQKAIRNLTLSALESASAAGYNWLSNKVVGSVIGLD